MFEGRFSTHCRHFQKQKETGSCIQERLLSQTAMPGTNRPSRIFILPEEFISKLYDWAMEDPGGATLEQGKPRKRRIALNTTPLTEGERRQREDDMLKSLAEVMKQK